MQSPLNWIHHPHLLDGSARFCNVKFHVVFKNLDVCSFYIEKCMTMMGSVVCSVYQRT